MKTVIVFNHLFYCPWFQPGDWMKFLWALAKNIYSDFWLKPVSSNKKYPHAKASGNSFREFILPNGFNKSFVANLPDPIK